MRHQQMHDPSDIRNDNHGLPKEEADHVNFGAIQAAKLIEVEPTVTNLYCLTKEGVWKSPSDPASCSCDDVSKMQRQQSEQREVDLNGLQHKVENYFDAEGSQIASVKSCGRTDEQIIQSVEVSLTTRETPRQIETEDCMRVLWAQVLNKSPCDISTEDNFFHIGGDVIKAMKLCREGPSHGLFFTVKDVFQNPLLLDLSGSANPNHVSAKPAIEPFSL